MTLCHCDVRPIVTFLASDRERPLLVQYSLVVVKVHSDAGKRHTRTYRKCVQGIFHERRGANGKVDAMEKECGLTV